MDDDPHSQIDLLKRKLTEERDDRLKTEGEACKILRGIRKKYDTLLREREQEVDELRSSLAAEQDRNQQVVEELKNQLLKSRQETMKLDKSSPRTPTPRTPVPASPSKSATKPNNADFIDSLGKEIADLKRHIEDYKLQLEAKQRDLSSAVSKQEVTKNINIGLREANRKLADDIAKLQSSLKTAQLDAEVKAAETISRLESERDDLKRKLRAHEQEAARFKRRESNWDSVLQDKEKQIRAQEKEIEELKDKCEKYRKEKELETEREKAALLSELHDLRKDLDKKSKDLTVQTSIAEQLKNICADVEKQADDFDRLLMKKTDEYNHVLREKHSLELESQRLRQEIAAMKRSVSAEKETQEKSVTDLRQKVKQLEENLATETGRVRALKLEVREERSRTEAECRRVSDLQEQLQQCIDEADSADNRSEQLESQFREIKEEAARHINEVFSLQGAVNSLNSSLAHANYTIHALEDRIESLLAQMEKEKQDSETEIYRLSERLRQHHELQNEMMTKIEKLEKTKKPLIGISPRPKSVPPSAGQIQRDFKDLDVELMKEKERGRELHQKLIRAETELAELRHDMKIKHFNDGLAGGSADPSAPPPPYLTSGSPSSSDTSSDNNINAPSDDEEEDGYNRHIVTVDVHHATSSRRPVLHRRREFSFTDSILEEIESDAPSNPPKTYHCTK